MVARPNLILAMVIAGVLCPLILYVFGVTHWPAVVLIGGVRNA